MGLVWFECIDDLSAETSFLSPAAELSVHSCLTLLHGRTEEHSELEQDPGQYRKQRQFILTDVGG